LQELLDTTNVTIHKWKDLYDNDSELRKTIIYPSENCNGSICTV